MWGMLCPVRHNECVDVELRIGREFDFTSALLVCHMSRCTLLSDLKFTYVVGR
jgi:hypothetical protein